MLVHFDCEELEIKLSKGYIEVDCLIGEKKCLNCKHYISYFGVRHTVEYKGFVKEARDKEIKKFEKNN